MTDTERVARSICSTAYGGFCHCAGESYGCKAGRGATPHWTICPATVDQLVLGGHWRAAEDALAALRDSNSRPQGEDSRSEAEGEGRQRGGTQ